MPYTPPAGDDADLQFAGPYTPRFGDDANLTWETGVLRAQSIRSTVFGTPIGPVSINSTRFGTPRANTFYVPTGWLATNIGDPRLVQIGTATGLAPATSFGTIFVPVLAKGFSSTLFGLPNSPYTQTCTPDGFSSTALGEHRLVSRHQVFAAIPSTVVSLAYTAVDQTETATGFTTGQLGTPAATRRLPGALGRLTQASGFSGTAYGTPNAAVRQTAAASGFSSTALGVPGSRGGRVARGFMRTKMGTRHRAKIVTDGRYVSGFTGGGIGEPSSVIRNRVAAIAPITTFGTPLLTRSTTC